MGVGFRISKEVSAGLYGENPQGRKSRADKKVKKNAGGKEKQVRPVFFKIEDRKILACTFIPFHLTKTPCYSTLLNVLFLNYFDLKNELSLPRSPCDLFFILDCLKGDKKNHHGYCRWSGTWPVSCDF